MSDPTGKRPTTPAPTVPAVAFVQALCDPRTRALCAELLEGKPQRRNDG